MNVLPAFAVARVSDALATVWRRPRGEGPVAHRQPASTSGRMVVQ